MDEYAYGFVTENSHYGRFRNPAISERIAGGSSGGSTGAVAAGFVPVISVLILMVPSAYLLLCAVSLGLNLLTAVCQAGAYLFSSSLDCVVRGLGDRSGIWRCCTISCKALFSLPSLHSTPA